VEKTIKDIVNDFKELDTEKLLKKEVRITVPSNNYKTIKEFIEEISKNTTALKELTTDDKITLELVLDSIDKTNKENVGVRDNINDLELEPKINDKLLIMKTVGIKKSGNRSLAKLRLAEALGIGSLSHIPLWHSGFWITIKPMTKQDKVNLMLSLSEEFGRVGRETNNLIFSNHSVVFTKILLEKIKQFILDTSLALPEGEDIFDYIKLQDLYPLVLGLIKSMYPKGVNYILQCKNTVIIENNAPKCNYKSEINIDPAKLLWVDMSKLTEYHKSIMSRKTSKSVNVDEIRKYQEELEANQSTPLNFTIGDVAVTLNIESPSINRYLEAGEYFITQLTELSTDMIKNKTVINDIKEAEIMVLNNLYLGIYNHYVKSIVIDGKVAEDIVDINEELELLSNNVDIRRKIRNKIVDYINNSLVSIVGIPDYVCPICQESQKADSDDKSNFKAFIPLNVFDYFFTHLGYQYEKILRELGES